MIVFLITFGQYENITIGPAFTNRAAAEAYQHECDINPQQTLGPIAPIRIVEIDVFEQSEEALQAEQRI